MIYDIDGPLFNAVMACCADRREVRFYLHGFFIDTIRHRMVATDGIMLGEAPLRVISDDKDKGDEHTGGSGYLFKPVSFAPKSVDVVSIHTRDSLIGSEDGGVPFLQFGGLWHRGTKFVALDPQDGKFPAYERVSNADRQGTGEVPCVAFDSEYLCRVTRATHVNGMPIQLNFGTSNTDTIQVRFLHVMFREFNLTFMPCRPGEV